MNLAEKGDIKASHIKKPRTCSRQTYQSNRPVETTKNYFKVVLTIPFLDHILTDLQYRFPGNELVPYRGLYLIPYLMFQEPENRKEEFMAFSNFYLEGFSGYKENKKIMYIKLIWMIANKLYGNASLFISTSCIMVLLHNFLYIEKIF